MELNENENNESQPEKLIINTKKVEEEEKGKKEEDVATIENKKEEGEKEKNDIISFNSRKEKNLIMSQDNFESEREKEDLTKREKKEELIKDKTISGHKGIGVGMEEKKKNKLPIIPYKIDDAYQKKLIKALKNHNVRPKTLFAPELDDIRENIGELDQKAALKEKLDEADELKAELRQNELNTYLNKYKESAFSGNTLLQDPYALFSGAEKAYIDQFYKLSDLFAICPLYFRYRISLEYCISEANLPLSNQDFHNPSRKPPE